MGRVPPVGFPLSVTMVVHALSSSGDSSYAMNILAKCSWKHSGSCAQTRDVYWSAPAALPRGSFCTAPAHLSL
eukprot:4927998-Amphidinium_carterae.4